MHIEITFDPVKDAMNRIQHGFPLDLAREIKWNELMYWVDERRDYGEVREVGYVPFLDTIFCVVFTRRHTALRIISLRRANDREKNRYARNLEKHSAQLARGRSPNPTGNRHGPDNLRPYRRGVPATKAIPDSTE
ncbi:BrnT family toxin [Caballeronia sp. BR00000012568055]|uniref:BrnT family toxin n=1 Tax=Caballeronia sp. BR00000012568055 TaxID=2918761 RepID=UPI0023F803B1|nr:BrnT family toxin [Caballeronia sp. BR00000012568055]